MNDLRRIGLLWVRHPAIDYVLAIAGGVALRTVDALDTVAATADREWYLGLAALTGLLFTMGALAITLLVSVPPRDRLAAVITQHGDAIRRIALRQLTALSLVAIVFTLAAALQQRPGSGAVALGGLSLATLVVLKFYRLWWIITRVVTLMMEPTRASETFTAPDIAESDYEVRSRSA